MLVRFVEGFIGDALKRFWTIALPVAASLLIVLSWPRFDLAATVDGLLRVVGISGADSVEVVIDWLRRPGFEVVLEHLPAIVGALFAFGGANAPLGNGRSAAMGWVLLLPILAANGGGIGSILLWWFCVVALVFLLATLSDLHAGAAPPENPAFFSKADAFAVAWKSILQAVAVPLLPFLALGIAIIRSLSWPPLHLLESTRRAPTSVEAA